MIAEEKKTNPAVVATEAWGWLPPPLHHEGDKVQTDWLHDFLMDPTRIRPAVVLRMPNFHMSSDEASKLVELLRGQEQRRVPVRVQRSAAAAATWPSSKRRIRALLDDAMKIVTDGNYCVKCHSVGDYQVRGAVQDARPELGRSLSPAAAGLHAALDRQSAAHLAVHRHAGEHTVRPDAAELRRREPGVVPGTSIMQLDGVVDLLMNFDEYAKRQTSVKALVKEPPRPADQPPAGAALPISRRDDQPPATEIETSNVDVTRRRRSRVRTHRTIGRVDTTSR